MNGINIYSDKLEGLRDPDNLGTAIAAAHAPDILIYLVGADDRPILNVELGAVLRYEIDGLVGLDGTLRLRYKPEVYERWARILECHAQWLREVVGTAEPQSEEEGSA
jgi:hypothetical protein